MVDPETPILSVSAWWDPGLAILGHDPLGEYAESHWLPVLGPSALFALRWFSRELRIQPQGFQVPHREFARALGLGIRLGRNAASVRCLERLCYFDLARPRHDRGNALAVRTHVPTLPARLCRRLPERLRESAQPG